MPKKTLPTISREKKLLIVGGGKIENGVMMFGGENFSQYSEKVLKVEVDLWLFFGEFGKGVILAATLNYFLILLFENFPQLYRF